MDHFPYLSFLVFLPLIGALLVFGLPGDRARVAKVLAAFLSVLTALVAAGAWRNFDPALGELQLVEKADWIPSLGVEYLLAVDGLSLVMILLTVLVITMAIFASPVDQRHPQIYFGLFLLLEAGLLGTFTAFNFFHWFIFWELGLIPAFFLIKLWGGRQRDRAALQFFIYTMAGSVSLFLGFLAIYLATGTFDFTRLGELGRSGELASALNVRLGWYHLSREQLPVVIFGLVFFGFAVKIPMIPFHTWLPLAYAEAPAPVTMALTGVMSKMGVYGLLRLVQPLFPEQIRQLLPLLLTLAVVTVVVAAFSAFAQQDLKRILAYSSINHLGYCLLGAFAVMPFTGNDPAATREKAVALNGVILQMFNHGLVAATLFCFVGFLEKRTGGRRQLGNFGGLRQSAPLLAGLMMVSLFASLGLPGLNGFVGEFLIFKGGFFLAGAATAFAIIGLLVSAVFILTMIDRLFHGPLTAALARFPDLSRAEILLVLPPIALMVLLGVCPQLLTGLIDDTVRVFVANLAF